MSLTQYQSPTGSRIVTVFSHRSTDYDVAGFDEDGQVELGGIANSVETFIDLFQDEQGGEWSAADLVPVDCTVSINEDRAELHRFGKDEACEAGAQTEDEATSHDNGGIEYHSDALDPDRYLVLARRGYMKKVRR